MPETSSRVAAIWIMVLLGLGVLLARAAQLQLWEGEEHAAAAAAVRTEKEVLAASRGRIRDRWGNDLVVSQESYRVDVTPAEFVDSVNTAKQIRTALGLSAARVNRELRKQYGYFAGPFTPSQIQPIRGLPGVYDTPSLQRFYPYGDLAASVLGHPAADGVEAAGIERELDTLLTGTPGSAVVLRDHLGVKYQSPGRLDAFPVSGDDVFLTLDIDLQDLVERSLAEAMEKLQAIGGDVVVMDPRSGEILAVASRSRGAEHSVSSFTSAFEPGSTAKIFAAAALLEQRLVTPRDSVWGELGRYVTPHRVITDEHAEGWLTLSDVVRRSSNIGIAKFASRLEPAQQFSMLRDFGLGSPTGIEFPAESPGILHRPETWSQTSAASLAMGYEVGVTMLQLAQAYAALANGGVLVQPTLVKQIIAPSGEVLYRHEPHPIRRVLSPENADTLRGMLRAVVYDGGTGRAAALATYEVAGKTGTAKRVVDGKYVPGSYTTTFVSLFPASDPQFVMVVKLDDPSGAFAAASAVPLTRSMLEQVLAGRTPALKREQLTTWVPVPDKAPPLDGVTPFVVRLPRDTTVATGESRVPDIRGAPMRVAARTLHDNEFQVHLQGWGTSCHTTPPAGTSLPTGSLVTLVCNMASDGG